MRFPVQPLEIVHECPSGSAVIQILTNLSFLCENGEVLDDYLGQEDVLELALQVDPT